MISAALSRQAGLQKELLAVANNIANANTTGYRAEGVIFSEYVKALDGADSISMTRANAHSIDLTQGEIIATKGQFDIAIAGEGFFLLEGNDGPRLTRAGVFALNEQSELVDPEGRKVLNEGEGAIAIPQGAKSVTFSPTGEVSVDGQVLGRLAVVVAPPEGLVREGDNLFRSDAEYEPAEDYAIIQGAVEGSNVNSMNEFVRLIEVQRAYEGTKGFLDKEAERLRNLVQTLGRAE
ncbi:MAG: flagellar basal-body rod protein FlgF [Alphaproteobacteria bacterium]|nr:flagellar basal-body rod protein FlgF [Alphaproteobacteria bacterium]